jgi:hypothetical protein
MAAVSSPRRMPVLASKCQAGCSSLCWPDQARNADSCAAVKGCISGGLASWPLPCGANRRIPLGSSEMRRPIRLGAGHLTNRARNSAAPVARTIQVRERAPGKRT